MGQDLAIREVKLSAQRFQYPTRLSNAQDLGLDRKTGDECVLIIDDDERMRDALLNLLQSVGLRARVFSSAVELLGLQLPDAPSCFVIDIRLPQISGLDFQSYLVKANIRVPIIFVTGHADIPMTVQAMKAGATDFLTKPFREQDMLDAIARALEMDRTRLAREERARQVATCAQTLTQKEREVLELVTSGLLNKQIAGKMGISEATVKLHRAQVVKKMGAKSLADLVRMADLLQP